MRILSSHLIVLMLISPCLISVPHSHAGTSVFEPQGHASRPHFHLHGDHHSHHDHGHDTGGESDAGKGTPPVVPDHDSDAVCGSPWLFDNANPTKTMQLELPTVCVEIDHSPSKSQVSLWSVHDPTQRSGPQECPIYLRTLSILC